MNVLQLLSKAGSLGVRVSLNGDKVKLKGPAISVAAIKPEIAAHKPEVMAHLRAATNDAIYCSGALVDPDGGPYLPWGPYISPDQVDNLRVELARMIATLAGLEGWASDHVNDVMTRAMCGPLSALLPDWHHFNARLTRAQAEAFTQQAHMRQAQERKREKSDQQ